MSYSIRIHPVDKMAYVAECSVCSTGSCSRSMSSLVDIMDAHMATHGQW